MTYENNKGQNHKVRKIRAKPQLHFKAGVKTQKKPIYYTPNVNNIDRS